MLTIFEVLIKSLKIVNIFKAYFCGL